MKFFIEFHYETNEREKILNFLHGGGLDSNGNVKLLGCWITIETGRGFALVEAKDGPTLYQICSRWSEYGEIGLAAVIDAKDI